MARGHFTQWPHAPGFVSQVWETALDITAGQFDLLPSDIQQQVLCQVISQEREMEYWNQQMHGLASIPPLHQDSRTTTPPMPLPLVDSHLPTLDHSMAPSYSQDSFTSASNWTPGWPAGGFPGSSPFRQEVHHGLPIIGTVSPDQLHPHSHQQAIMSPAGCEDMGLFTFSDSDGSLPGCHFQQQQPPLPYPVSSGRGFKNTIPRMHGGTHGTSSHGLIYGAPRSDGPRGLYPRDHHHQQQQQQQQQPRRPLPSGRFRISQGGHVRSGSGARVRRQSPSSAQLQPALLGNGVLNNRSTTMTTTPLRHPHTSAGRRPPHHEAAPSRAPVPIAPAGPSPHHGFPPGRHQPGFVPFGDERVASRAQGNEWPVARDLMERIVAAERNVDGRRSKETQLTYKQIKAKYWRWKISESTLRGIKRVYDLPKEHRERVPTWNDEHIQALRRAIPCCTDYKGHVAWGQIVELIKRDTGKPFGATTVRKKWQELVRNGLDQQMRIHGRSLSGGEEGDNEDLDDDSSDVLEAFNISDDERI